MDMYYTVIMQSCIIWPVCIFTSVAMDTFPPQPKISSYCCDSSTLATTTVKDILLYTLNTTFNPVEKKTTVVPFNLNAAYCTAVLHSVLLRLLTVENIVPLWLFRFRCSDLKTWHLKLNGCCREMKCSAVTLNLAQPVAVFKDLKVLQGRFSFSVHNSI